MRLVGATVFEKGTLARDMTWSTEVVIIVYK